MKNKRSISILFVWIIAFQIILLTGIAFAKPVVEWNKTFGEADNDEAALSVAQTEYGGYIVAGKQFSGYGTGVEEKALLIKTDANGNKEWIRTFGEGSGVSSVQQTRDKGYILTGYTTSSERGDIDIWLLKTDENGNSIWNKTFGEKGYDIGVSGQLTKDGGYILTGIITRERVDPEPSYSTGDYDILLIKTDENGNQQWNRTFGGKKNEVPDSLMQTSDGGFIIAAWTESYGNKSINGWLIKTDINGLEQWNKVLDENYPTSVQQTEDNGYIIAGYSTFDLYIMRLSLYESRDAWLIKTDGNGNTEWKKTFSGYMPYSVRQTKDNGYIVAGESYPSFWKGQYIWRTNGAWVLRTNEKGEELWSLLPGDTNYIASSILQTEDGSYVLAGSTESYAMGRKSDAWLMKLREVPQTEKSVGFEIILAMAMLLGVYIARRKN